MKKLHVLGVLTFVAICSAGLFGFDNITSDASGTISYSASEESVQEESEDDYDDTCESDTSDTEYEILYTTEYPDEPEREPDIAAEAAIVMDATTGNILYAKEPYKTEYPASITKIMTCLLALENCTMDETVTMSYDAVWGIDRSSNNIALVEGESLSMEDCLYALMLESANEVAWGIGEHISGTIDDFGTLMTNRAKELGCINTNFVNANGLPDENHYSCCYDMALITREALKSQDFRTITGTLTYTIGPTNLCEEERNLWQHCKMIRIGHKYTYEYCEGGKTGYTTQALNTLVTWSKKDDMELICVIMKCNGAGNAYTDSKALYNYCYNNFNYLNSSEIVSFTDSDAVEALSYLNDYYNTSVDSDISLSIPADYMLDIKGTWNLADITTRIQYSDQIDYDTASDNYTVGKLIFSYDGEDIGSTELIVSGYSIPDTSIAEGTDNQAVASNNDAASPSEPDDASDKFHIGGKMIAILLSILAILLIFFFSVYISYIRRVREANRKRRDKEINSKR